MSEEQPLDLSVGPRAKRQQFKPNFSVTLLNREPEVRQPNCQRIVQRCTYNVQHNLHASMDLINIQQEIAVLYRKMLEPLIASAAPNDLISVVLQHEEFLEGEFYMEYQKKQDITYQELGRAFHVLLQSNTRFLLDGKLTMVVACIIPVVGGNDQLRIAGRDDFNTQWKSLRTHIGVQQTVFAAIWRKYNITVNYNVKVNEDILKDLQHKLRHLYKIVVVRRPTQIPHYGLITKVFEGDSEASEIIYLEYVPGDTMDDGHYNYIKTVGAYHGAKGYCTECCHTHSRVGAHFCSAICRSCGKAQCTQEEEMECEACKVICRSSTCLEVHQAKQCKKFKYCTACEARYAPVKGVRTRV
ncbi:hypothetical protein HDE_09035 [Halotydeus destructor]|nr:hypothetical protein HDE_09035 [Halotydeus destructor]